MTKKITVFGGSTPAPGEPAYEEALELGRRIGQAGLTVLTGGYSGTMEAVSRGANETGGHVIGVTSSLLESWRPKPPNQWVIEEIRFKSLRDRMYGLIDNCDAALALPGGIGTLAEIAATWSALQTGEIPPIPLILIGPGWEKTFQTLLTEHPEYIAPAYRNLLIFCPDSEAGFDVLLESFSNQD